MCSNILQFYTQCLIGNSGKELEMKRSISVVVGIAVLLGGCMTSSPRGGNLAGEDQAFRIMVPRNEVDIRQGEIVTIPIEIKRDKFFRQDVTLRIEGPEQIRIDPQNVTIEANEAPLANVRFAAPSEAPLGSYRINLTATPSQGKATSAQFLVRVRLQELR